MLFNLWVVLRIIRKKKKSEIRYINVIIYVENIKFY